MPAASYDMYVEQGATYRLSIVYGYRDGTLDANGNANVVPYDITGCKARLQVRRSRSSPVLISATTDNGGIVFTDPVRGRILITFTDEATDGLTVRRAKYDMEITYPSGDVVRALQGTVHISPNITQDAYAENIAPAWARQGIDEQLVDKDDLVRDQASTY